MLKKNIGGLNLFVSTARCFLVALILLSVACSSDDDSENLQDDEPDTLIAGETDLREPERQPTVDLSLPAKDSGDIDVMRPGEDDKPSADSSLGGEPSDVFNEFDGVGVKSIPSTSESSSEGGPQLALDLISDVKYAKFTFYLVDGEIIANSAAAIPGEFRSPNTLKGNYIWTVSDSSGVVEVGSFLDPLEQHTAVFDESTDSPVLPPAEQGSFRISLSSSLVGERLRSVNIDFYRLETPLPPSTILNSNSVAGVLNDGNAVNVGSARGTDLYFQFGQLLGIPITIVD